VTEELITLSRYQPLQTGFTPAQLISMRGWWPFLLASIVMYGLLPRLLLWVIFQFQTRRAIRDALLSYPGAQSVLARINAPMVSTQAITDEAISGDNVLRIRDHKNLPRQQTVLISWAGALDTLEASGLLAQLQLSVSQSLSAGKLLDDDTKVQVQLSEEAVPCITIAVKGWEPPLQELKDFVAGLPSNSDIYLLLIPLPLRNNSESEISDWETFINTIRSHALLLIVVSIGSAEQGGDA